MSDTLHCFIAADGCLRSRWREAFPAANVISQPAAVAADVFWLLLPAEGDPAPLLAQVKAFAPGTPLIVLSDQVNDAEGLNAFSMGASGYCNGHSLPDVLRQVALTVQNGGVWVGPSLMERLVSGVFRRAESEPSPTAGPAPWKQLLTERELDVVEALSTGAANKEIARRLDISERTVKAHLGAIFEKLKVRDRLQLTLLISRKGPLP